MKTWFVAPMAITLALASTPARAQQPAPAPAPVPPPAAAAASTPSPSPVLTAMLQDITLTPAQRLKVDSILAYFRNQAPPLPPGTEPDSAMLQRFRDLSRQSLDGVRTVLTREQQQVWDRNVERVRAASMRVGP